MQGVRGKVSVGSSQQGTSNNAVWNYVYADSPTGCTTLGNSVNVNVPIDASDNSTGDNRDNDGVAAALGAGLFAFYAQQGAPAVARPFALTAAA